MKCRRCGSPRLVLDGIFPTRGGHEYRRYHCDDCGHRRSKHVLIRQPQPPRQEATR